MSRIGKLIVIEGLDGSGKATQAALLAEHLQKQGQRVTPISFPDYGSKSSTLVKMYLAGEIGSLDDVNTYAASTFYAADRYISYQTGWKEDYLAGATVIADRYTTSNVTHQMAKLPREEWDSFLHWLWDLEFTRMGLPAPDLVLYLDMRPETSRALLEKRYGEGNTGRDLHESNLNYLLTCRGAALHAADKLGWKVLRCCDGKTPLPIEEISAQVALQVEEYSKTV